MSEGDEGQIETLSGVSAFDGKPFVVMRWGNKSAQFTPDDAREFGLHIIECACAAELDALVVAEMQEAVGLDAQTAGQFLVRLRARREKSG